MYGMTNKEWRALSTAERVAIKRHKRSITHRGACAAREIDGTLSRYFPAEWEAAKNLALAACLAVGCSLSIEY